MIKLNKANLAVHHLASKDSSRYTDSSPNWHAIMPKHTGISITIDADEQRVRYAIACALSVYKAPPFVKWANDWLRNVDRSESSAWAAEAAEAGAGDGVDLIALAEWAMTDSTEVPIENHR